MSRQKSEELMAEQVKSDVRKLAFESERVIGTMARRTKTYKRLISAQIWASLHIVKPY